MKTSFFGWAMGIVAVSALVACGDDTTAGTGGAGGEGQGGATTATTTTTTTGNTTVGNGGGDTTTSTTTTGGGGEGGAPSDCEEITLEQLAVADGDGTYVVYEGSVAPNLDGDGPDLSRVEFYGGKFGGDATGEFDLSEGPDDNYSTCGRCVLVATEIDGEAPTFYYQSGGTMTVNEIDLEGGVADFSLAGVTLVEVEIGEGAVSTPVDGGACLRIADGDFALAPPQLCESGFSTGDEATDQCLEDVDGACAAFEACSGGQTEEEIGACIDCILGDGSGICDDALAVIYNANCFTPDDEVWTCDDELYWDGETCDCACGTGDPDCDVAEPPPAEGCEAGETCSGIGVCVPPGWTCDPSYYGAADGCDCECGIYDSDCDLPDATVFGCEPTQTCSMETATCEGDLPGCADRALLTVDADGTTLGGDEAPSNSCSFGGLSTSYSFTTIAGGSYTFTLESATDQGVAIRTDCQDGETEVDCADLEVGGENEVLTVDLLPATNYTVIVQAFSDGEEGPFTLTVDAPL